MPLFAHIRTLDSGFRLESGVLFKKSLNIVLNDWPRYCVHAFNSSVTALYYITTWSQTNVSSMQPLQSLYKQALKIMDKKPVSDHYCKIIKKYNLLTFEHFLLMANVGLLYKIIHNLAPPPFKQFVTIYSASSRLTRASTRGDCYVKFWSTTFEQNCFSVKAAGMWNSLPLSIRESNTFKLFKLSLKT